MHTCMHVVGLYANYGASLLKNQARNSLDITMKQNKKRVDESSQ